MHRLAAKVSARCSCTSRDNQHRHKSSALGTRCSDTLVPLSDSSLASPHHTLCPFFAAQVWPDPRGLWYSGNPSRNREDRLLSAWNVVLERTCDE